MSELNEIYLRARSNDALASDPAALAAVKWDRVETKDNAATR